MAGQESARYLFQFVLIFPVSSRFEVMALLLAKSSIRGGYWLGTKEEGREERRRKAERSRGERRGERRGAERQALRRSKGSYANKVTISLRTVRKMENKGTIEYHLPTSTLAANRY